jgi:hypothetical protein
VNGIEIIMKVRSIPQTSQTRAPGKPVALCAQSGVALAIVVWFIAGMSLLVAGIVSHARVDTQMAQLHVARAKAVAAGDGAIQLMMADVVTGDVTVSAGQGLPSRAYRIGDLEVVVDLVPTAGLVDLNSASAKLLAALFVVAAQLDAAEAQTVANNVIKWRSSGTVTRGRARFATLEDLLRVEGIGRTLLDAVRDYVVAGAPTQRGTNWPLAPEMVWAVMQKMDPQKADAVLRSRDRAAGSGEEGKRKAGSSFAGGSYRLDAVVHYGDKAWLRRRWVSMTTVRSSLLPWRMVRTEAPRVVDS